MRWVRRWWRQQDRFDWFSVYLDERGMRRIARFVMAGVSVAFALVAAAMLWGSHGPADAAWRAADGAAAIIGAVSAVFWLRAWPTLNQSRAYVFVATLCIAAACLAQRDPLAGLMGSYAFVVLGVYIALMHCAKATLYNFTISLIVGLILAFRVSQGGSDIILAVCSLAMVVLFSAGAPVLIATTLQIMATDIARAERDALTGLYNRRGFYRHVARLLDHHAEVNGDHFTVVMIDLDNFKRLNDREGHSVGDQALAEIARALRANTSGTAVVARAGGEEFLVADLSTTKSANVANLCDAIAATTYGVTASVGCTTVPVRHLDLQNVAALIDELVAHADAAMYDAKAAGGNQSRTYKGHGAVAWIVEARGA